ncbi:MAG TPA: DOPA 4,5-dioxygenase family protein [Acetobacteraceae bacterium]|jgi:DOPA 4,5-dioxygenase|nr:DOPA 4,5-dioxygenase family protein [Acetobacteraceae bacterium]
MTESPTPVSEITSWHAHVYYEPSRTRDVAERLREWVSSRFSVQMGRWHDATVGPHPVAMYQIAFETPVFASLVPFLALNRMGLTILVHPNTDNPHDDHLENALWMGAVLDLDASMLPKSLSAEGKTPERITPNTTPDAAA